MGLCLEMGVGREGWKIPMATWNGRTRGSGFDLLRDTLGIVMNMFARRTGAEMDERRMNGETKDTLGNYSVPVILSMNLITPHPTTTLADIGLCLIKVDTFSCFSK